MFYCADADEVAPRLIGCRLLSTIGGELTGGTIVEAEAYRQHDPASHSYRGLTERNKAMFGPPGHAYVYAIYGMHFCLNVVTAEEGRGEAVLLRAIEPEIGVETMRRRRGVDKLTHLCSGPARLCEALGITRAMDGHPLNAAPLWLETGDSECRRVVSSCRIGIALGKELPWRFLDPESPHVSRRA